MDGIVGINRQGGWVTRKEITLMLDSMAHRGPHGEAVIPSPSVGLGQCQLTPVGHRKIQSPFSNQRGDLYGVFNGQLDNEEALRRNLSRKEDCFPGEGARQLLLQLYEEEGTGLLSKIQGVFSLAIWDGRAKRLLLARDRLGVKPLYYYHQGDRLIFASEIKALLVLKEIPLQVNQEALWHYLTLQYVPEPFTLFAGIQKLPPGHFLLFKGGELELTSYWQLRFPKTYLKKEPRYYVQGVMKILEEIVADNLAGSSSVGAFLSGGIDSAILVALLSRYKEDLQAFTVSFPHQNYNESLPASQVAKELGVSHYQLMVTPRDYLEELPQLIWQLDEPLADPSAISLYFAASLAKDEVQVVFSGEGADEIFAGYPIYGECRSLAPFRLLPPPFLSLLKRLAQQLPPVKGKSYLYRATTPLLTRYLGNAFIFSQRAKEELLQTQTPFPETPLFLSSRYQGIEDTDPLTQMQYVDLLNWMPGDILMKADKMTAACSLSLRAPFLHHRLFEFAVQIPPGYRLKGGESKYILRQVAQHLLGRQVARRKKQGFPTPIRIWLKKELFPLARELFSSSTAQQYFSQEVLNSLLKGHCSSEGDYSRQLWTIMVFILWHQQYFS